MKKDKQQRTSGGESRRFSIIFGTIEEKVAAVRRAKSQGRSLVGHIRWLLAQDADGNTHGK